MKGLTLTVALVLFVTAAAHAEERTNTRALWSGTITSGGMCSAGIAFSKNPSRAASIGIPVAFVGNLVAWKIGKRHPKVATLLQIGSGSACLATGLSLSSKPKPILNPLSPPSPSVPTTDAGIGTGTGTSGGSGGTGGNTGSGGSGSTGSGGTGSSGGSGAGSTGSGNTGTGSTGTGGTGGTGTGGTGSGGSGTDGEGSGSGIVPRCLQDCGLGNHGVNTGNDTKKPPFPGLGPKH